MVFNTQLVTYFIHKSLPLNHRRGCLGPKRAAQNQRPAPPAAVGTTSLDNLPTPPDAAAGKLDYRNPAADTQIPVEADNCKPVTDELQATVVELLQERSYALDKQV